MSGLWGVTVDFEFVMGKPEVLLTGMYHTREFRQTFAFLVPQLGPRLEIWAVSGIQQVRLWSRLYKIWGICNDAGNDNSHYLHFPRPLLKQLVALKPVVRSYNWEREENLCLPADSRAWSWACSWSFFLSSVCHRFSWAVGQGVCLEAGEAFIGIIITIEILRDERISVDEGQEESLR